MEFMIYEKKDTTALITINRPKALNAFNSQMLDELTEALEMAEMGLLTALFSRVVKTSAMPPGASEVAPSARMRVEGNRKLAATAQRAARKVPTR